jgi:plastocyanin
MRRMILLLAVAMLACGGDATPQGPGEEPQFGSVRGSVHDEENAAVPAVQIQLARAGHSPRATTTDAAGAWAFSSVEQGSWNVAATPPAGFIGDGVLTSTVTVTAGTEAVVPPFALRRSSTPPPGGATVVNMVDNAFAPTTSQIPVGGTVRWVNTGGTFHNSTGPGGAWSSGDLAPGSSFERTFPQAGTFSYECTLHPGMTGTVTVQ